MSGSPDSRPPVVAVVGRPNVGKSSLFNRVVGQRRAIVDDEPGVTRDRLVALVEHGARHFLCIDTGGFDAVSTDHGELIAAVRQQTLEAVEQAQCVIYVLDTQAGIAPADEELARLLRQSGRPIVVAANKVDVPGHVDRVWDLHRLGIDPVVPVSAAHGRGIAELLDAVVDRLPDVSPSRPTADGTRLALLGRPNVGKSSLLNRLLGAERTVVSATAGTTRDTVDTPCSLGGRPYVLIDTAGIRRRGRVRDRLEGHGAVRALGMLTRTDVVAMVLDAREGMTEQDARLVGRALEAGRAMVLAVNKWDLLPRGTKLAAWRRRVEGQHPALAGLPAVAVSAQSGAGLRELVRAVHAVEDAYRRRIGTAALNRVLQEAIASHAPPSPGGRAIRLFYATQTAACPPVVTVFASAPSRVPTAYQRYLANTFRDAFALEGAPIRIQVRSRRDAPADVGDRRRRDDPPRASRGARRTPRAPRARRR